MDRLFCIDGQTVLLWTMLRCMYADSRHTRTSLRTTVEDRGRLRFSLRGMLKLMYVKIRSVFLSVLLRAMVARHVFSYCGLGKK